MGERWTIGSILTWTKQYFADKGVASPRLDAEVLLSHVLGKDRMYLYVNFDQPLEAGELAAFREAVKQRARRVPVAYITGRREFFGLPFAVTPAVLIPRPDTEVLVEAALRRLQGRENPLVLDVGTGSGAIIVSLLYKLPTARGVTTDISAEALAVATGNAAALGSPTVWSCAAATLWSRRRGGFSTRSSAIPLT
jgi:release factor glutamine methyltransferase